MENDDKIFIEDKVYTKNNELKKVFRLDYKEQNIQKNKEFQKWKYELDKKYGKSIRIYKCKDDKIFFYHKINDEFDEYIEKCPECYEYICCFCSQIIDGPYPFSRFIRNYFFLKRLFYFLFYREKIVNKEDDFPMFIYILGYIAFIIPNITGFGLILTIIQNLFCLKRYKHAKLNKNNFPDYFNIRHFLEEKKRCIFTILEIISIGFALCMTIPYIIFIIICIIIIFLISIPFKMIPLNNFIFYLAENSVTG